MTEPIAKVESKNEKEKPSHSLSQGLWPSFPYSIEFIRKQRNLAKLTNPNDEQEKSEHMKHVKGLNALMILSAALFIEGFMKECLATYVRAGVFGREKDLKDRIEHDFYKRIMNATFEEFPDLFFIATGKKLSEIVEVKLRKSVQILISFRNGICHARSPLYFGYGMPNNGVFAAHFAGGAEYQMEYQYKKVHGYLVKENFVKEKVADELFTNDIADHFTKLITPYANSILKHMPIEEAENVMRMHSIANGYNRFNG